LKKINLDAEAEKRFDAEIIAEVKDTRPEDSKFILFCFFGRAR
jgi:hypothetical protein